MRFFGIFLSLHQVFFEIAHDNSLRRYLTSSRGKTQEAQSRAKQAKIGPKITFFAIFSSLDH